MKYIKYKYDLRYGLYATFGTIPYITVYTYIFIYITYTNEYMWPILQRMETQI